MALRAAVLYIAMDPQLMATTRSTSPSYPRFKAGLFALLTCNAAIYALRDAASNALDAIAWLVLLVLFELETEFSERLRPPGATVIHVLRIGAILAVVTAMAAYFYEKAWLDVINSGLWIAVVVMLEFEVRFPYLVARGAAAFLAAAVVLYAGLAVLVVAWAWRGEWLDAYDALIWLIAFATIEMDVLRFSRRISSAG